MSNLVSNQNTSSVNYQFKILYALGMIFVTVGHSSYSSLPFFENWFVFSSFHLGLFVFCSGYFYKESSENNILGYFLKKLKTLILPLYLWNLFYALVTYFFSNYGITIGGEVTLNKLIIDPIKHGHQFIFNLGGWFVIPLFIIELFNILICKLLPVSGIKKFVILFILYIVVGIIGNNLAINGYNQEWWLVITRVLYLLPFYGFGMLYKVWLEGKDRLSNKTYFLLLIGCQLAILNYLKGFPIIIPAWAIFNNGPFIPIICGFVAISFWVRIARIFTPICGKDKWVLSIANNTYTIMINQFLGFMLVKSFFAIMNVSLGFFPDFDFIKFKTDIWYYYFPNNLIQFGIIYIIAGIVVPIYMQKCVTFSKSKVLSLFNK